MRHIFISVSLLIISTSTYANIFADIISLIAKEAGITNSLLNNEIAIEENMLTTQEGMEKVLKQVNGNMTGSSGLGFFKYQDYQSYGSGGSSWVSVIEIAKKGQGSGDLGHVMRAVSKAYSANKSTYNQGVRDTASQQYYATKTETLLAVRAASELDYNKIQEQIDYQKMLLKQIDQTKDLKAAMDLANRINIESNLINLEILRQSTLVNQQQAINEQGSAMGALSNARFLTK